MNDKVYLPHGEMHTMALQALQHSVPDAVDPVAEVVVDGYQCTLTLAWMDPVTGRDVWRKGALVYDGQGVAQADYARMLRAAFA